MTIGGRLRDLRRDNNLTQDELGEICGVTKGMVSQWESNLVQIPTERIIALRRKLQFSCDWLITGSGDATLSQRAPVRALMRVAQDLPDYAVVKLTREGDTYAELIRAGKDQFKDKAG